MGAKVIIFCKFLISKFLKGLTHSALGHQSSANPNPSCTILAPICCKSDAHFVLIPYQSSANPMPMVNVRNAHLRIAHWGAILRWAILSPSVIRIAHPNYSTIFTLPVWFRVAAVDSGWFSMIFQCWSIYWTREGEKYTPCINFSLGFKLLGQ